MFTVIKALPSAIRTFAREEEGAQIIEYALIVAVVSLGLIGLFSTNLTADFTAWIDKVGDLLNPPAK